MDILQICYNHINSMITCVPGYKVLLMDNTIIHILSYFQTKSSLLKHDISLCLNIELDRSHIPYAIAITFISTNPDSVLYLQKELADPKYGFYYVFFNSGIPETYIRSIAVADKLQKIQTIKEIYLDYYPILHNLVIVDKSEEKIRNLLKSFNCNHLIRYQTDSVRVRNLAQNLNKHITVTRRTDTLLLILDRSIDMLTPLLTPWIYMGMIHEYFGITNNSTTINSDKINLILQQDTFIQNNIHTNWGTIGVRLKELLTSVQKVKPHSVKTLEDIQRIALDLPNTIYQKDLLSKHLKIYEGITSVITKESMYNVCLLEQEIVNSTSFDLNKLMVLLNNKSVSDYNKARLIMIYCLCYPRSYNKDMDNMIKTLTDKQYVEHIKKIIKYKIQESVYPKFKLLDMIDNLVNLDKPTPIYVQYRPYLETVLDSLFSNKLSLESYPYTQISKINCKITKVIVYFVGGITFMESSICSDKQVLFSGDTIHNTKNFMDML